MTQNRDVQHKKRVAAKRSTPKRFKRPVPHCKRWLLSKSRRPNPKLQVSRTRPKRSKQWVISRRRQYHRRRYRVDWTKRESRPATGTHHLMPSQDWWPNWRIKVSNHSWWNISIISLKRQLAGFPNTQVRRRCFCLFETILPRRLPTILPFPKYILWTIHALRIPLNPWWLPLPTPYNPTCASRTWPLWVSSLEKISCRHWRRVWQPTLHWNDQFE